MSQSVFGPLRRHIEPRVERWLQPRLKPARAHQLSNRRLFILPSRAGVGFMLLLVILWLTGTNYENNMVLLLAFFLTALFVVCIHHTFFNMSGLRLEALSSAPCFLGEDGELLVQVSRPQRGAKESIALGFTAADSSLLARPGSSSGNLTTLDLIDSASVTLKLFARSRQRGWYQPPRLLVESYYPLGLIRCWSWLVVDLPILVYPRPLAGGEMPLAQASEREGGSLDEQGAEDFHGFRAYQPGISPRHIAWKHYARGQGLYSKEYASYREQKVWLDWEALEGQPLEVRLSRLCHWVLRLSATQQPYGLRLPGLEIAPATGLEHRQQVLKALALFQSPGVRQEGL